jgi:hypothetical protein
MTREVEVVWLVDSDPPSPLGRRAFYPETPGALPPDRSLMSARFDAIRAAVRTAGAPAVVTVHTSPRHRADFLALPYLDEWRACLDAGLSLALHPHEDLPDGRNRYDDAVHLARVITDTTRAREADLPITAFRSGTFAWNPALPSLLEHAGITLDLSPGPGLHILDRNVDWPAHPDAAPYPGTHLLSVPIGWNGAGSDLNADYLFVERMNFAKLSAVWSAIRARVQRRGQPALCNLLCHGFGLADPRWRDLTLRFLDHLRDNGGAVIAATDLLHAHPA